jgi:hypothetical protein
MRCELNLDQIYVLFSCSAQSAERQLQHKLPIDRTTMYQRGDNEFAVDEGRQEMFSKAVY